MTEDEAKKKWCPFSRILLENGTVGAAVNRYEGVPEAARCLGSACMAWRWSRQRPINTDQLSSGYCGLAGGRGRGGTDAGDGEGGPLQGDER